MFGCRAAHPHPSTVSPSDVCSPDESEEGLLLLGGGGGGEGGQDPQGRTLRPQVGQGVAD